MPTAAAELDNDSPNANCKNQHACSTNGHHHYPHTSLDHDGNCSKCLRRSPLQRVLPPFCRVIVHEYRQRIACTTVPSVLTRSCNISPFHCRFVALSLSPGAPRGRSVPPILAVKQRQINTPFFVSRTEAAIEFNNVTSNQIKPNSQPRTVVNLPQLVCLMK
jgi:hypothetical protein